MARQRKSRSKVWTPPRWRLIALEARVARVERTLDALLVYLAAREMLPPEDFKILYLEGGSENSPPLCHQPRAGDTETEGPP